MPLYEDTPLAPTNPKPDVVRAWTPGLQTAVIDTRYQPQSEQIAWMEGSIWVVDYYSQILDKNDELGGQDPDMPAPLQQYRRIWSMELKVTQDLTQVQQDPSSTEMVIQGQSNVYPFLVPQQGDMFRAGTADGREGLFKVIRVERRQIFAETAHVIEYQLIAQNDGVRIYNLDQKVQVTYYFVKDFLLNHQNPLLIEEDYFAGKKLEGFWHDIIYLYFNQFYSREFATLVVPQQFEPCYDHALTYFVKTIMDSIEDVHIQAIRQLNIGDDGAITSVGLYTMLERRDPKLMKFCYTKTGLTGRLNFAQSGLLAGMRYIGIAHIVYPENPKLNIDFQMGKEIPKPIGPVNIVSTMPPWVPPAPPPEGQIVPMPLIKPVDMSQAYVLSTAFYTRDNTQYSLLEKLLLDYLDFRLISSADILKLCEDCFGWEPVEKFYYFPLLLLLIKYSLRRL